MENEEKKKDKRWLLILLLLLFVGGGSTLLITHPWKKAPEPVPAASTDAPTEAPVPSSEQPTEPVVTVRPEDDLRRRLKAEGEDTIELTEAVELTGEPVTVNGTKTLTGSGSLADGGLTGEYIIVIEKNASLTIDGPDVDGTDAAPNGILVSEGAKLDLAKGELKNIRFLGVKVLGEADVSGRITNCGSSWMDIGKGAKVTLDGAGLETSGSTGLNVGRDAELTVRSSKLTGVNGFAVYNDGTAVIEDSEFSDAQLYVLANGGTMSVKGGKISDGKTQGLITNYPGAELTVEGTELEKCKAYMVYNSGKAEFTGAKLTGSGGYTVYNAGNEADITLRDTTVTGSGASSLYNRKDCTMQLENVTVEKTGGHALINRGGIVTAKGFYSPDKVKSYTIRNDSSTDSDLTYGSLELDGFDLAGSSDNFCVINYGGKLVLKNGTVGKSTNIPVYIRDGEAELEQVKVLGVEGDRSVAAVQVGKEGIMSAVVTMTDVDFTGAPRGITNYGHLTFNSGLVHDNKTSGTLESGGGVNNFGTFIMNGGAITDNTATQHGGGVINQGTMELNGGVIANNKSGRSGGALMNTSKGWLTITGGELKNNTAGHNGGGIYNAGVIHMKAGTISGNKTVEDGYGGGVSNAGSFNMYYGNITGNVSCTSGGGLFNASDGTMLLSGGNVTYNRTSAEKSGGGIYNTGKLTLQGTINVANNTAAGSGGGVSNGTASSGARGNVTISGGTFSGNTAVKSGGGISNLADMTISGGTIKSNTAKNYGGGLYTGEDAKTTISGGQILSNRTEKEMGGGVANRGYLTMTGGSVTSNISGGAAGGLGNFSTATAILSGGSISNNRTGNEKGGGGIYNVGKLTLKDKITISGNVAEGAGGAVNNNVATGGARGSLTIAGGTLTGNTAGTSGGAVCNKAEMTVSGGSFTNNKATNNGGGIFADEGTTLKISGGSFSGNKCGKSGGAVYTNGKLEISGGTYKSNAAEASGGAVCVSSKGTGTVSGGSFSANKATNNGGGLYNGGSLTMTGGTVDGNSCDKNGGGIFNASTATASVTGGTISANKSGESFSGGGIYNTGKLTVGGSADIVKNVANGASGGGIANGISGTGDRGQLTVSGGKIRENEAGKSGAAILNLADMKISGGTFSGNKATNNGGVLYTEVGSTAEIRGAVMTDNKAGKSGGALFLPVSATVSGCTMTGNTAGDKGGAIYVKAPAEVTVDNCKIDKNVSTDLGSAVMVYQGKLTIKDSTVLAEDDKRAVYSSDADFTLDGTVNAALCSARPLILANGFKADSKVSLDMKSYADGQVVLTGSADVIAATYDKSFTLVDLPDGLELIEDGTLKNPDAGMEAILYDANGSRLASGSLAAMISRAESGQTVELIADAEIISRTVIAADITLRDDGMAHTITVSSTDRGFSVSAGGKLTIKGEGGLNFVGGGTTLSESAIYLATSNGVGGELDISGKVSFSGFTGGAGTVIMNTSAGKVSLDGTVFENNDAGSKNGGAVYNNGQMTLKDVVFRNNKAASGGGLFNYTKGVLTAENLTFEGNETTGGGGAVYNNGGTMTVDTAGFTGNSAGSNGGMLQVYGGSVTLKNVTASGNTAPTYGNDIYSVNGNNNLAANLTLIGGTYASGTEGGIRASVYMTGTERILGGKLTANIFTTKVLTLQDDFSAESEITLYLDAYAAGREVLNGTASVIEAAVDGDAFTLPELPADLELGTDGKLNAVQLSEAEAILFDTDGTTKVNEGSFTAMLTEAADGQTVQLLKDVTMASTATIEKAITVRDDGTARTVTVTAAANGFEITTGSLTVAGSENGGLTFSGGSLTGSCFCVKGGKLELSGKVTVSGFDSKSTSPGYGGAAVLLYNAGSTAVIDGASFSNNKTAKNGGAIFNNGGTLTITNAVFSGNAATTSAGAVYNTAGGTATITGSTFENNTAAASGGAVYNNASTLTVTDSTFSGNKATGASANSGALHVYGGTVVLNNVSMSGNSCGKNGQDVMNADKSTSATAKLTINGGSFSSTGGTGQAVHNTTTLTLDGAPAASVYSTKKIALANDFSSEAEIELHLDAYTEGREVLTGTASVIEAAVNAEVFTLPELPEDLILGTDGKLQAKPGTAVEAILYDASGEKKNEGSLADMLAAAGAGETVEAVADAAISSAVTVPANITLRDDGTARTVTAPANGIKVPAGTALTLSGNGGLTISCSGSGAAVDNAGTLTLGGKLTASVRSAGPIALAGGFSAESAITLYLTAYEDGQTVLTGENIAAAVAAFTLPDLPNGWTLEADGTLKAPAEIPPEAILYNADGSEALRGTFAEAWAAISADGQILEIKANVTAESVLSVNKDLTIRDDGTARTVKIAAAENGFAVEPGKTLTVTGSENGGLNFTCGSDAFTGSAIFVKTSSGTGGTLNVSGKVSFSGFTSTSQTANVSGGAAICVTGSGKATIDGTTFTNNKSTTKGGGAIYSGGSLTVRNAVFTGNSSATNAGGAIFSNKGTLTVENSTFTNNTSKTYGGAFQLQGGTVTLTNVTASSNTAEQWGKDVYAAGSAALTLTVNGGSFGSGHNTNVNATSCSIVIANNAGTAVTLKGSVTADIHLRGTLFGTLADDFSAQSKVKLHLDSYAADRKVLGGSASVLAASVNTAVTMPGLPEDLKLAADGYLREIIPDAILYNADGSVAKKGEFAAVIGAIGADGQILEIKADVTISSKLAVQTNLTIRDDGTARTVTVAAADRGMEVASGKTLTITGSSGGGLTFAGGSITGAGIQVNGTLNVSGKVTFSGFSSSNSITNNAHGSAIYNSGAGTVDLNGTLFENNSTTTGAGGALYNGGRMTMTGVTFNGNTAKTNGGVIHNYSTGTLTMTNVTVKNSTSTNAGGAIYNNGGKVTVTGSSFTGNKSSNGAGGVFYNKGGTLTVESSSFTSNNAKTLGGAMQLEGGTVTLTNVTASSNTAAQWGKDVYSAGGAATTLIINGGSYESGLGGSSANSNSCSIVLAYNAGTTVTLKGSVTDTELHVRGALKIALGDDFATTSKVKVGLDDTQFTADREVLTGDASVIAAAVEAGVFTTTNAGFAIGSDGRLVTVTAP